MTKGITSGLVFAPAEGAASQGRVLERVFTMLKFIATSVLGLGLLIFAAGACHAGPVQKSPVQAPPAPATARAEGGYRTYSYEPGAAYRPYRRTGSFSRPSYMDARSKALGW